ncbi:MAG: hypothetical protein NC926_00120 [Candidatus Omnitrophica bacterium]|nr:hypothetical protein [Candidatus Omnitrophota bacterium]MCM8806356.1 hypothetical protein [Candidatus Omnitrophota bacterium]
MIEGKIVKIRFKKYFQEQKLWVFVGKVLKFTENWIMIEGKGIVVIKGQVKPVDIDSEKRIILIPRDNIAHIRILPDNFDIERINVIEKGLRLFIKVEDGPDTSISEI